MGRGGMGVSCLRCVVKPCATANEDDPRRRCPKASKCGSRIKDHKGTSAGPNGRNIKRRIQSIPILHSLWHHRDSCQLSGSLPYVAETPLCGLSQAYPYVC